ncbi:MAG: NPCBM/NEW2 domain-containing protein [Candidatus Hinthialibacter antarcticus]|nr:NPCBM/NEW2 domain-containing protein [Candidatus Hinthialibacter antarcticus]
MTTDTPTSTTSWTPLQIAFLIILAISCAGLVWNAYAPADIPFADLKFEALEGDSEPLINIGWNQRPLQIQNKNYPIGLAVETDSLIELRYLPNGYRYFSAEIGVSADEAAGGPNGIVFTVLSEGTVLYQSPVMRPGMPPRLVWVPVLDRQTLALKTERASDDAPGGRAVWALARFVHH